MYVEEPAGETDAGKPSIGKAAALSLFIPAVVCAGISVLLTRAGFLAFFFFVPMGVCAAVFGPAAAWLSAVIATLGNGVLSAGGARIGLDVLFLAVLTLGFTWMMAGSPPRPVIPPVRTVFRFITVSIAGALVFLAVIFPPGNEDAFSAELRSQIEAGFASYIAAAGTDAAQRAFMEQTLTVDRIIEVLSIIMLRGGALVSALFLFFFNRQAAFLIARLFRRQGRQGGNISGDLIGFHAPRRVIWIFSLCFPALVLFRITSLEMLEIAAWNILVICVTMFLAQGGGIVLFNLARRPLPTPARLLCVVVFICVIFSPGINALALIMLILLGIAENWLPLRVRKQETPGIDG